LDPQFRPLFTVEFTTTPQIVGTVPAGYFRRAGIVTGGSFTGERLSGRVLSGGSDWVLTRPDGVTHLDVRVILETDGGDTISLTYGGRLRYLGDSEQRLAAGEAVPEEDLYFRTLVQFETAAEEILWLNDIVAVGIGRRRPEGPSYRVFELL
jgi:hypothetical protein